MVPIKVPMVNVINYQSGTLFTSGCSSPSPTLSGWSRRSRSGSASASFPVSKIAPGKSSLSPPSGDRYQRQRDEYSCVTGYVSEVQIEPYSVWPNILADNHGFDE